MNVELLDVYAKDIDVVNSARVSFDKQVESMSEADEKLINYLMKNQHGTPFEHNMFRWYVEAPIFVVREWQRHRIGWSYNEMSGRYTEFEDKFYVPETLRTRVGRPGDYEYKELALDESVFDAVYGECWVGYKYLLNKGVAPEQARMVLPVSIYTKMYATCNARSLMNFLSLRTHPTAQQEIQDCAKMMEKQFEISMPVTYRAWVDNGRGQV